MISDDDAADRRGESMPVTLALAGDTMLGRSVADRLMRDPGAPLLAPEVVELAAQADVFMVNLECCISDRGAPFVQPGKRFFFRAPPVAAERLAELGVGAVTLANNHALDFGAEALLDTLDHLHATGVATVGAGPDEAAARAPLRLRAGEMSLRVVAVTDHPAAYAAAPGRPGVAYADLRAGGLPGWLHEAAAPGPDASVVVVAPHWGPNMCGEPVAHVRRAARALEAANATLVAGHSAHVFQAVAGRVLYDLGDFLDDYATDPRLRNDLGLLWLVTFDAGGPRRLEAVPLALDYCYTRIADARETAWIRGRFVDACTRLGTDVHERDGRLVVTW
jgi:poly-gamma-glutamate capsule biosynthesis protein CapA/YwtB (metallophosphatase superfamily)